MVLIIRIQENIDIYKKKKISTNEKEHALIKATTRNPYKANFSNYFFFFFFSETICDFIDNKPLQFQIKT